MGRNRKRIAHNAVPVRWRCMDFCSFKSLDQYLGLSDGFSRVCWKKGYLLFEHEVFAFHKEGSKVTKRWSDVDMMLFGSMLMTEVRRRGTVTMAKMEEIIKELEIDIA